MCRADSLLSSTTSDCKQQGSSPSVVRRFSEGRKLLLLSDGSLAEKLEKGSRSFWNMGGIDC